MFENLDKKVPDINGLVTKTNFNTKAAEIVNKIPNTGALVKKLIMIPNYRN